MTQCEMCGRETEVVYAKIEEVEMKVCQHCSRYGQVLRKPVLSALVKKKIVIEEPELVIVENYARLIKDKREDLGLSQEDFAKTLNEKLSTMHSVESGHLKPDVKLAQKIKKAFGLNLIKEIKKEVVKLDKAKSDGFTLGDFIKKKN